MSRFEKYLPSDILKPYVKYFAISENEQSATYKVLPDTSLVMGFQYKGGLTQTKTQEAEIPLSPTGVTGLQNSFKIFSNIAYTGSVLVYFSETGASAFFRNPLHELFAESISLDNFIKQSLLENLQEQLSVAQTDRQRIGITEQFLIALFQPLSPDLLVEAAIQYIYHSKGIVRIKKLAENLCISQSPLEKRFKKIVGASPKKFASIVRFQSLVSGYSSGMSLTEIAYESGYYDQAHFIKDFKLFTGETPEKFLLKK